VSITSGAAVTKMHSAAPGFRNELGNQKRHDDAEREARRVERDRAG
jgi:hypothetical protein